jgi:hypothetical protein
MTVEHSQGRPETEGLYAVEIHFGWKLLEWYAGAWWHMRASAGGWLMIPCNGLDRCRRPC